MKQLILLLALYTSAMTVHSQNNPGGVLAEFFQKQSQWKTISYNVCRTDTLVTDDIRTLNGVVRAERLVDDSITGFQFVASKQTDSVISVYDGHYGYDVEKLSGDYLINAHPDQYLLINGGGMLIPKDLFRLDTAAALSVKINRRQYNWVIRVSLPDIKDYNVVDRYKEVIFSQHSYTPLSFRYHQSTLGKVQDLFYQFSDVAINTTTGVFEFPKSKSGVLGKQSISREAERSFVTNVTGQAPSFTLPSMTGDSMSLAKLKGKVVLLDFWEVWCGPCQEALPKVEALALKYQDQGLVVLGINSDLKSRESAMIFLKKRKWFIHQLLGNEDVKNIYRVNAVPHYVLISTDGQIIFSRPGYSEEMEEEIIKALKS
jgi:thiol-disulfide isomerase/thioredoxin